jgi:organic radical activating enzyme
VDSEVQASNELIIASEFPSSMDYPEYNEWAHVLHFIGCDNRCFGCQNQSIQDYRIARPKITPIPYDEFVMNAKRRHEEFPFIRNIVLSGGDPLYHKNLPMVIRLLHDLNSLYNICIYTGKEVEEVKELDLPRKFKYLICGKYEYSLKQESGKETNRFILASKNQGVYDVDYNLLSKNGVYYYGK